MAGLPANIVSCSVKLPRKHCAPGGRASLPHTASLTDELTSGSYGDEVIIRLISMSYVPSTCHGDKNMTPSLRT